MTIHGLFPNDKRDVCARIVLFQNSLTGNWICVVPHGSTRVTGQMDPNGWSKANRGRIAGHAMSKQDHQGDEFDGHEWQLFSQSAHSQDFMLLFQCLRPVTCARIVSGWGLGHLGALARIRGKTKIAAIFAQSGIRNCTLAVANLKRCSDCMCQKIAMPPFTQRTAVQTPVLPSSHGFRTSNHLWHPIWHSNHAKE